ncbi:hypothetical protein [Paenibacillus koleovorans]|uniref:hypothetical protein n=1 Tax=Paenibacillus koleovorans TaxID=121608 RepID=UPI000FDB8C90|nr:hypothetical protein [Paenibacillus koleovorans]
MKQFSAVIREYTIWLTSFRIVRLALPYHLYILFGGLGLLLIYDVLIHQFRTFWPILHTLGHYAFFAGLFLTLAAPAKKYMPYALWGYVFYILFPFKSFTLYQVCESALYVYLGFWIFKYEAIESLSSKNHSSGL